MSRQIHRKKEEGGGGGGTIDLLRQSKRKKAAGLLPRKELRVGDGKTMEKGRSRKKVHSSREISLENGCRSRSTTPCSMKENGFRRLTVDDSRRRRQPLAYYTLKGTSASCARRVQSLLSGV